MYSARWSVTASEGKKLSSQSSSSALSNLIFLIFHHLISKYSKQMTFFPPQNRLTINQKMDKDNNNSEGKKSFFGFGDKAQGSGGFFGHKTEGEKVNMFQNANQGIFGASLGNKQELPKDQKTQQVAPNPFVNAVSPGSEAENKTMLKGSGLGSVQGVSGSFESSNPKINNQPIQGGIYSFQIKTELTKQKSIQENQTGPTANGELFGSQNPTGQGSGPFDFQSPTGQGSGLFGSQNPIGKGTGSQAPGLFGSKSQTIPTGGLFGSESQAQNNLFTQASQPKRTDAHFGNSNSGTVPGVFSFANQNPLQQSQKNDMFDGQKKEKKLLENNEFKSTDFKLKMDQPVTQNIQQATNKLLQSGNIERSGSTKPGARLANITPAEPFNFQTDNNSDFTAMVPALYAFLLNLDFTDKESDPYDEIERTELDKEFSDRSSEGSDLTFDEFKISISPNFKEFKASFDNIINLGSDYTMQIEEKETYQGVENDLVENYKKILSKMYAKELEQERIMKLSKIDGLHVQFLNLVGCIDSIEAPEEQKILKKYVQSLNPEELLEFFILLRDIGMFVSEKNRILFTKKDTVPFYLDRMLQMSEKLRALDQRNMLKINQANLDSYLRLLGVIMSIQIKIDQDSESKLPELELGSLDDNLTEQYQEEAETESRSIQFNVGQFIRFDNILRFHSIKFQDRPDKHSEQYCNIVHATVHDETGFDSYKWHIYNKNSKLQDLLGYMYSQNADLCKPDEHNQFRDYSIFEDSLFKSHVEALDVETNLEVLREAGAKYFIFLPLRQNERQVKTIRYRARVLQYEGTSSSGYCELELILSIPEAENTLRELTYAIVNCINELRFQNIKQTAEMSLNDSSVSAITNNKSKQFEKEFESLTLRRDFLQRVTICQQIFYEHSVQNQDSIDTKLDETIDLEKILGHELNRNTLVNIQVELQLKRTVKNNGDCLAELIFSQETKNLVSGIYPLMVLGKDREKAPLIDPISDEFITNANKVERLRSQILRLSENEKRLKSTDLNQEGRIRKAFMATIPAQSQLDSSPFEVEFSSLYRSLCQSEIDESELKILPIMIERVVQTSKPIQIPLKVKFENNDSKITYWLSASIKSSHNQLSTQIYTHQELLARQIEANENGQFLKDQLEIFINLSKNSVETNSLLVTDISEKGLVSRRLLTNSPETIEDNFIVAVYYKDDDENATEVRKSENLQKDENLKVGESESQNQLKNRLIKSVTLDTALIDFVTTCELAIMGL